MNKYIVPLAVCSVVVAVVSFFKLSKGSKQKANKPIKSKKRQEVDEDDNNSVVLQDRVLYDNDVCDKQTYSLIVNSPTHNPDIDLVRYEILLNCNKGTTYEGVVKIKTISYKKLGNKSHLYIDFSGKIILYLSVNGRRIDEEDVFYHRQQIQIKKQWLSKQENNIQIIFANKYAFMGDGLTTYFPLDDNNKYSLKGQVIYTRNGPQKITKMFPCLNILNSCEVKLETLHPDNFQTFSNTPRSMVRVTSKQDYPYYGFFFQANQRKLNRSFSLGTSFKENNSSIRSFEEVVKNNTQFYEARLNSIHDFFLLCSAITQVRPSNTSSFNSKDLLVRYFAKDSVSRKAASLLNILQCQISEISARIEKYKLQHLINLKCHNKIDIFFIDDIKAEGDFYIGSILLNQSTIQRGICDRRMFYLLCRAFIGMALLQRNKHQLMSLKGCMELHELTLQIFPECIDFIFAKNKQYDYVHKNSLKIIADPKHKDLQVWFKEYYEKQCRYFITKINEAKVGQLVFGFVKNLQKMSNEEFWTQFIAAHPFLQGNVSQIIIKIGIKEKGIPSREAELQYAKKNFLKSKYYLKLFTNEEIQNDLKRFIQLGSFGIEKRIPFIKMKEKYLQYINEKLENYLNIKANRLQAKNLYDQFKRYNEARNFHHISALRREVKRIKLLAKENIIEQRKDLQCGLMGWKLLRKLEIFPQDQDAWNLIRNLQKMKFQVVFD